MFYFVNTSEKNVDQIIEQEIVLEIYGEKISMTRNYLNEQLNQLNNFKDRDCRFPSTDIDYENDLFYEHQLYYENQLFYDNQLLGQIFSIMIKKFREKTGINLTLLEIFSINYYEDDPAIFDIIKKNKIDPKLYEKYAGTFIYEGFIDILSQRRDETYENAKIFISPEGYKYFFWDSITFLPIDYIPDNKEINDHMSVKDFKKSGDWAKEHHFIRYFDHYEKFRLISMLKIYGKKAQNINKFSRRLSNEDKKTFYILEEIFNLISDIKIFLPKDEEIKIINGNITKKEIFDLFDLIIIGIRESIRFWKKFSLPNIFIEYNHFLLNKTKDLEKFPIEFQKRLKKSFFYKLLLKKDKENS